MSSAFGVGFLGLLCFVSAMFGPQEGDLQWRKLHHAYYGIVLMLLGLIPPGWLLWIGAFLLLDDGVQHILQRVRERPTWRPSLVDGLILPLVWKIPGVAKLTAWLERP